jgi:transposase
VSTATALVRIDVAEAHLDIAARPAGTHWRVPSDAPGIAALLERLRALTPALVVPEATGGHALAVASTLAGASMSVAVVYSRQVRQFARAVGQLAERRPMWRLEGPGYSVTLQPVA